MRAVRAQLHAVGYARRIVIPSGLPLRLGHSGPLVRDLNRRLAGAGIRDVGEPDVFDEQTEQALKAFQASRRLIEDGICGRQSWGALVDAAHRLGDRMLYLRSPMTRGDDVTELQQRLGSLGFDAGYVDGIFGPDTQAAVRLFQHNQGVNPDGMVGAETVAALARLAVRRTGDKTVAEVREIDRLSREPSGFAGHRLVIGEGGGIPAVVDSVARRLRSDGAEVLTLHHPDLSVHARTANDWEGTVYLGITLATKDWSAAYFSTEGFVSAGGRHLARCCEAQLGAALAVSVPAKPLRIPILRETRMPAVWCRLGPPSQMVQQAPAVAGALREILTAWCREPIR